MVGGWLARHPRAARWGLLAAVSGLSLGGYLLAARLAGYSGFPLDDAWIHQTYARSLGLYGEWAFLRGQPSAGSTAPLWSLLLAPGHTFRLGPQLWGHLMGWLALTLTAGAGAWAAARLRAERSGAMLWVGIFLALEWHLVWAAGSGMETLLFAALTLVVLGSLLAERLDSLQVGVLIGLSMWVRPDGLTLLAPALLVIVLDPRGRVRLTESGRLLAGFALPALLYLAFNRAFAGAWWPNTFFAKQAEYAIYRELPLWKNLLRLGSLPLVGPGLLLLPGFAAILVRGVQKREWGLLAGACWVIGYIVMYALRLPVTYQYGRYLMPVMPVYMVWSLVGVALLAQPNARRAWKRVFSRVWLAALAAALVGFWLIGARAYARDVTIIETEMVATARWVAANTPTEALVAAHDIGALGYFGERRLLDLAGLVSPEVIPFIRDEARLASYLDQQRAQYLVTFPGWYPELVQRGELLYISGSTASPEAGGENMAVYHWHPR